MRTKTKDKFNESYAEMIINNLDYTINYIFTEVFIVEVWNAVDDENEFSVINDYMELRGFDNPVNFDMDVLWELLDEVNILEIVLDDLYENHKIFFKDINGNLLSRSRWKGYFLNYG